MTDTNTQKTHRDLVPRGMCPALMMKRMLTFGMDDWCTRTCRPVGSDDELVHPKDCLPGRSCYDGLPQG